MPFSAYLGDTDLPPSLPSLLVPCVSLLMFIANAFSIILSYVSDGPFRTANMLPRLVEYSRSFSFQWQIFG